MNNYLHRCNNVSRTAEFCFRWDLVAAQLCASLMQYGCVWKYWLATLCFQLLRCRNFFHMCWFSDHWNTTMGVWMIVSLIPPRLLNDKIFSVLKLSWPCFNSTMLNLTVEFKANFCAWVVYSVYFFHPPSGFFSQCLCFEEWIYKVLFIQHL